MPDEKPIPFTTAVLLCDTLIADSQTGKKTLVGIFDKFGTDQFPLTAPAFSLYARLTDMEGAYKIRIDLVNLEDEERLFSFSADVESPPTRLEALDLAVQLNGIKFPRPGRYEFQLHADEVYIGRTTVIAETRHPQ